MNKAAPSFGRIAAMVVFALSCFGLLLFLWLAFGGPIPLKPKGYRINASFAEAANLATEADVRISGVPVGKVKTIEPDKQTGRSIVQIELETKYAPLPSDARAILRQKTLLGETYVELTPGTADAPKVPENGSLRESQVSDTVQLDEIFRTFDADTRAAFQTWMQEQAKGIGGYGRDINDALGNLAPFAEDTARLVDILNRQEGAVRGVFAATASRDEQLKEAFRALPTFESESRETLDRLAEFAQTTDPLITQLRPAARELSPTLQDIGALSPDLKALFRDLGPLIDASRTGFPAAERILRDARPLIGQLDPAMRQITPILQFIGLYKPELTAFFANSVTATQAVSSDGIHYLRTTNPFNPENLAVYPRRIGTNRPNAYAKPGNFLQLRSGMPVFENRHCGRGVPSVTNTPLPPLPPVVGDLVPDDLLNNIVQFAFNGTNGTGVTAPPCRLQGRYDFGGEVTQYPHVRER
jgi:phospholipid/cholesterol/gamma-HCH transport system substrate-binding protein